MSLLQRFWRAVALAAAALLGLGLVFWLAANWDDFGRAGRFALLQGTLLVSTCAALARRRLRAPGALLAWLAIGGVLAYSGQTYQTGADPWQLFAWWTLLGLPLALAARSDLLWLPWCVVAHTAIALWLRAHTGELWALRPAHLPLHAAAWAAAAAVAACVSPWAQGLTHAGRWSWRLSLVLTLALVTSCAGAALLSSPLAPQFGLGLVLLAAAVLGFAQRRSFDAFSLAAALLALDTLLVLALARWLLDDGGDVARLLLLGLLAAALLALSVRWLQSRAQTLRPTPAATAPQPALPASAASTVPWLLTSLGAWLAALPLLGAIGLLLGDSLYEDAGPYLVGGALLVLAAWWLQRPQTGLFASQFALPLLLSGLGTLGYGLARDLPLALAASLVAGLLLVLAWVAGRGKPWLQQGLAAAAAAASALALVGEAQGTRIWLALHAILALGMLGQSWAARRSAEPTLRALSQGWIAMVLALLALASGWSWLAAGAMGLGAEAGQLTGQQAMAPGGWTSLASAALGIAAVLLSTRAWPMLRRWDCLAVAAAPVALCLALPALGGTLLATVVAVRLHQHRLGQAGSVAAVWIVGTFYYALAWPLAHKAVLLVVCGAALALLAWHDARTRRGVPADPRPATRGSRRWLVLGAVATLAVVNTDIWRKEQLIAHGQPLFVALAPVDPRSLMQGDYMALAYALPDDPDSRLAQLLPAQRPQVIARRDARGVAELLRIADAPDTPRADGEIAVTLTPHDGGWTLVSDAWHFREGEAERWARARYGEFRVMADGRALLVGLADEGLRPLR
jgi:uncharacterized membrane-anchored protein